MQFCQNHWTKLKETIEARGLEQFVAKSGEEAAVKLVADPKNEAERRQAFEPLMAAHNAIVANALNVAGLGLMTPAKDGGETCPVCYLVAHCSCGLGEDNCHFNRWLDHAADDQREIAVNLGLLGGC